MKRENIFSFLLLLIILIFAFSPAYGQQNDYYIVGGKRIGPVMLGQPLSNFESFLGPRKTHSPTFLEFPDRQMAVLVKDGTIEGIMVYSNQYKTKEGLKVGSTVDEMVKLYGNYLKTDTGSLIYTDLGMAVNVENNKITNVMVIAAEPDALLGDKTIEPGVRVGNIKIGMDVSVVEKYWGSPDSVKPLKEGQPIQVYEYGKKAVRLFVGDGIVHGILVNSYKFRTPEGIGINSAREQVIKTYGTRYKEVQDSIKYNALGIGFYFEQGKVVEILVDYRRE